LPVYRFNLDQADWSVISLDRSRNIVCATAVQPDQVFFYLRSGTEWSVLEMRGSTLQEFVCDGEDCPAPADNCLILPDPDTGKCLVAAASDELPHVIKFDWQPLKSLTATGRWRLEVVEAQGGTLSGE